MPAAFKSAAELPPRQVMRMKVHPLTLGHVFLLHEVGSPYLAGEEDTIADLFLAVFICAQPAHVAKRRLSSWWLSLFFAVWGGTCKRLNISSERGEFIAYLRENLYCPPVAGNGGKPLTAPWHLRLYASLRHLFHMEHAEAMALSIVDAHAIRAACAEDLGKVELRSQDSLDFVDIAKKMRGMATEEERDAFIREHNKAAMASMN